MARYGLLAMRGWLAAALAIVLLLGGLLMSNLIQEAQTDRNELNTLYDRLLNPQSPEEYDAASREIEARSGKTERPPARR